MKPHRHAELIKKWADGSQIEEKSAIEAPHLPPSSWKEFSGNWNNPTLVFRIKPEPPKYPQTKMTQIELLAYHRNVSVTEMFTAVANAAIARAIDDRQVVPVESISFHEYTAWHADYGNIKGRQDVVEKVIAALNSLEPK